MVLLFFALPAAFYGAGKSGPDAAVYGVGFWVVLGVVTRFLVFEFRQFRAGRVARKIEKRVARDHPGRDAVIEWIAQHNDGNFLNTVLKKLGVSPWAARAYGTPLAESVVAPGPKLQELAEKLLGDAGSPAQSGSVQTYVFTSTQSQMLNEDGEWVTVHSSTSGNDEGVPPSEAVQKAMALLGQGGFDAAPEPAAESAEPPSDFEPIPLSPPGDEPSRATRGRPRGRRPDYMPLQLEDYEPNQGQGPEEGQPEACSTESER
jgi:hypothetical protein